MSAFTYFILGELRYLTLPSNIGIQKAMESSAFPNIIMVKLMKLKMYTLMNISMSPKLCKCTSSCISFHWKHPENTLFRFDCYSEGNVSIKKGQGKNLVQATY